MPVISFINQKGGTGKTTNAVHLAVKLAESGKDVVLVDCDAQKSATQWVREAAPTLPIIRLVTADEILDKLQAIAAAHEYVVIDGPAGLAETSRAALFMTDLAIVPCTPSTVDLRATDEALKVVRQVQNIRKGPPTTLFAPTRIDLRERVSKDLLEAAAAFGIPMTPIIARRTAYQDAPGQGSVVWRMGRGAEAAAVEMNAFLESILSYVNTESKDTHVIHPTA